MTIHHLDEFTKGWFVGAFSPTLVSTPHAEVGIKVYKAGAVEPSHQHKVATELTAVISGRVRMMNQVLLPGQIMRIEPGECTAFEALEDSVTVVVKTPCVVGDKYVE
jgi:quercetin dioxygenase-like cupin family protein